MYILACYNPESKQVQLETFSDTEKITACKRASFLLSIGAADVKIVQVISNMTLSASYSIDQIQNFAKRCL